jgi:plasmid stability protein
MSQVLIRGLDPELIAYLKAQAKQHGRSLEAELRNILTDHVPKKVVVPAVPRQQSENVKKSNSTSSVEVYFQGIADSLTSAEIEQFHEIYFKRFGVTLSDEQVREKGLSILVLVWYSERMKFVNSKDQ